MNQDFPKVLTLMIMVGAPCSGKTTWINENRMKLWAKFGSEPIIVSRDIIREKVYGSVSHTQTKEKEDETTKIYYKELSAALATNKPIIILDNTHLRESYINNYFKSLENTVKSGKAQIFIKLMDEVPYWKLWLRNKLRKMRTGKYIPEDALKRYHTRFKELKPVLLKKYKDLIYEA